MTVIVTTDAGDTTVAISPLAQVMWEKDTGQKLSDLQNGTGMGDLARMVWHQLRAQNLVDRAVEFEGWLAGVIDLEPADGVDPQVPAGAPSGG
jgi:hypothetical protein